jgi:cytochrome c oxidase subunit III
MATTTQPPQIDNDSPAVCLDDGGGGGRPLLPSQNELPIVDERSAEPVRTGIWVGLAAIAMSFVAFTSALFVREGSATDWHHLALPPILFFNTAAILASSVTLEVSRRRVRDYMRDGADRARAFFWLYGTLALGLIFVSGQYLAWLRLGAQGLYLATNPNSSFFYVLTAVHACHVLGGLCGLTRVIYKLRSPVPRLRRSTLDATSYYWHFMGILWLYLLLILWVKL